jgi:hypothetical protein
MTSSKTTHPAFYRTYQFFVALKASLPYWAGGVRGGLSTEDEALVASFLGIPLQQQLFARMSPNDQRHAIAVVRTLQQAGHAQTALMQAALLHDVAKSMGQPIIHRVLIVLLKAFWPAAWLWLSGKSVDHLRIHKTSWWRRPFVIHAHHPAIGAAWAKEAGCEPLAVRLIARHQDVLGAELAGEEEHLLAALQWADDLN